MLAVLAPRLIEVAHRPLPLGCIGLLVAGGNSQSEDGQNEEGLIERVISLTIHIFVS